MRLTQDDPNFDNIIVLLNDKPCKCVLAADDEEGWVDIPDIQAIAPLESSTSTDLDIDNEEKLSEWEQVPVVRKTGKVEFYKINNNQ